MPSWVPKQKDQVVTKSLNKGEWEYSATLQDNCKMDAMAWISKKNQSQLSAATPDGTSVKRGEWELHEGDGIFEKFGIVTPPGLFSPPGLDVSPSFKVEDFKGLRPVAQSREELSRLLQRISCELDVVSASFCAAVSEPPGEGLSFRDHIKHLPKADADSDDSTAATTPEEPLSPRSSVDLNDDCPSDDSLTEAPLWTRGCGVGVHVVCMFRRR